LSHVLGEGARADAYAQAADTLYEAFNERLWNANERAYGCGYLDGKLLWPTAHAGDLSSAESVVVTELGPVPVAWSRTNTVFLRTRPPCCVSR